MCMGFIMYSDCLGGRLYVEIRRLLEAGDGV